MKTVGRLGHDQVRSSLPTGRTSVPRLDANLTDFWTLCPPSDLWGFKAFWRCPQRWWSVPDMFPEGKTDVVLTGRRKAYPHQRVGLFAAVPCECVRSLLQGRLVVAQQGRSRILDAAFKLP